MRKLTLSRTDGITLRRNNVKSNIQIIKKAKCKQLKFDFLFYFFGFSFEFPENI